MRAREVEPRCKEKLSAHPRPPAVAWTTIGFDIPAAPGALHSKPHPYRIIALVERTPAWWDWRRAGIGSADAATILGEKRATSVEKLFLEKLQGPATSARTFEQARSAIRERQARAHYCRSSGIAVKPACVESVVRPWQRASLDGLSAEGDRAVEIKCGQATYASTAARQRPARQHYPQLQHILAVTGFPLIDYWCYCPPHPPLRLEVRRDDAYIERLLAAEEAFWRRFATAGPTEHGNPSSPGRLRPRGLPGALCQGPCASNL